MAKIPLRLYDREIENLIDRGQIEEAIAHCKHILKIFPKHIDTYRLLGKAYLESQRYGDAADIFQRVLSVVPDDFVSQVGMSIIREDEGKLDLAIWHMERAFEVQSANTAVQEELKRLYSRRDGVEPPKVRLTRGALVRMYARGDLYQQAIAEIRSALSEDPQRMDMQVLLARMYALAGQKVEAAEVCSSLLKLYPFCLEANRILAEILPSTSRADDSDVYKQRIIALDPYYGALTVQTASLADLPDNAITLERLEWDPMQEMGLTQPRWADTLGIKLEEQPATQIPDWLFGGPAAPSSNPAFLEGLDEELQPPAGASDEKPVAEEQTDQELLSSLEQQAEQTVNHAALESEMEIPFPAAGMDLIPDWMKDAGWITSDKDLKEVEAALSTDAEPAAEPGDADEGEELAPAEIPEWLLALAPADLPVEEEDDASTAGLVEALGARLDQGIPQKVGDEAAALPDWLTPVMESAEPAEIISPTPASTGETSSEIDLDSLFLEAGLAELPVTDKLPGESVQAPLDAEQPIGAVQEGEQEEALAWLEGLAAKHGAPEETLTTRPEDRPETPPAWVQEAEISITEPDQIAGSLDESQQETPAEEIQTPVDLPAWLQTVELDVEEPAAAPVEAETEEKPELPAWLQQLELEEEPIAMESESFSAEQAGTEGIQTEELPEWLSQLAASPEPISVEQESEAEPTPVTELPAWLVELKATPEEEIEPLAAEQPQPEMEMEEIRWITESSPGSVVDLPILVEKPALESEPVSAGIMGLEEVPAEQPTPELLETELPEAFLPVSELSREEPSPTEPGEVGILGTEFLPTEPLEFEAPAELPSQEDMETAQIVSSLEEAAPASKDWVQEFNPDEEAQPDEGELPISEWKSPENFELPAELADLVASIERERAAMEAAGSPSEPITGPALNVPIEMDQEATQAWLDQLATLHTSEAKTVALRGKEPLEKPPKWVEDGKAPPTQSLVGAPVPQPTPEEELPSWLRDLEDENILPEATQEKHAEPSADQLPSWLQGLADAEFEAPTAATVPSAAVDASESPSAVESLADTGPLHETDLPDIQIFEVPVESVEVTPSPVEDYKLEVAEWLDQIKEIEIQEIAEETPQAVIQEVAEETPQAVIEETPAESVVVEEISWAFEPPPAEVPEPVLHFEEVPQAEEVDLAASLQKPTDPQLVEEVYTRPEPEPVVAEAEVIPEDRSILSNAQNNLWRGEIDQALPAYMTLVRSGMFLEEIIQDMRDALYQHPLDVGIWETLGDAYARNHCLQEALDAYTKAEELIR